MTADICGDNRFELIEKYKQKLIESTNIETSPGEMAELDSFMFRVWQMGWLDAAEKQQPRKPIINLWDEWCECPVCNGIVTIEETELNYCPDCGQAIDWRTKDE